MQTKLGKNILRVVTLLLAGLFLLSATLNLGFKLPLGFLTVSFSSPSTSIAEFEILIGIILFVSAIISNLYLYGGAYLFATVGIAEGLLSADVQGLARNIHETMIPFAIAGWILLIVLARARYKSKKHQTSNQRTHEIVTILQFFVGGLVTLGGAAYAATGTYSIGTALGTVHLAIGITGLFGGYIYLKRKAWSRNFLLGINSLIIVYSAFAETLAEIYAYLPRGINDALIGTIIAIIVSAVIIYTLLSKKPSPAPVKLDQQANLLR